MFKVLVASSGCLVSFTRCLPSKERGKTRKRKSRGKKERCKANVPRPVSPPLSRPGYDERSITAHVKSTAAHHTCLKSMSIPVPATIVSRVVKSGNGAVAGTILSSLNPPVGMCGRVPLSEPWRR
jgi:hypothetical protein